MSELSYMRVDPEVKKWMAGMRDEIGANRTLRAKDEYNKGFNAGMDEAIRFINAYINGKGLFQIKTKSEASRG